MSNAPLLTRRAVLGIGAKVVGLSILAACSSAPPPAKPAAGGAAEAKPTSAPAPTPAPKPTEAAKPAEAARPAPVPQAGPTTAPSVGAAQGDRLVVALPSFGTETPFAWDSASQDMVVWQPMFDNLVEREAADLKMKPALATEWSRSADGKTWTFKLRQGIKFHGDWGEVTSEDVKFIAERTMGPDAKSASTSAFRATIERLETPDPSTFVVVCKAPNWDMPANFSNTLGYMNVISKKHVEQVGLEKASDSPIGTGPFRFLERRRGDFVRFEAVQNHWRKTPNFKQLTIQRIEDQAGRLNGLRAGEIDITQLTGDFLKQAKTSGLRVFELQNATPVSIQLGGQVLPSRPEWNPMIPWVGDVRDAASAERAKKVRLAMAYAIDKQALVDHIWQGYGKVAPMGPWYYPFHRGFDPKWMPLPYDPAKAKELLKEAGYPNGFEVRALLMPFPAIPEANDLMQAAALDWEKLGLKVKLEPTEFGKFRSANSQRKEGAVAWAYGPSAFDEPAAVWPRGLAPNSPLHFYAEREEYGRMLDDMVNDLDEVRRGEKTRALGELLYQNAEWIAIGFKSTTWGMSKRAGDWPQLAGFSYENHLEYVPYLRA